VIRGLRADLRSTRTRHSLGRLVLATTTISILAVCGCSHAGKHSAAPTSAGLTRSSASGPRQTAAQRPTPADSVGPGSAEDSGTIAGTSPPLPTPRIDLNAGLIGGITIRCTWLPIDTSVAAQRNDEFSPDQRWIRARNCNDPVRADAQLRFTFVGLTLATWYKISGCQNPDCWSNYHYRLVTPSIDIFEGPDPYPSISSIGGLSNGDVQWEARQSAAARRLSSTTYFYLELQYLRTSGRHGRFRLQLVDDDVPRNTKTYASILR
jgi:hypothetical protein